MRLVQGENGKWFWVDGSCTSQDFDSREAAERAATEERDEMIRLGLDPDSLASAGILEWTA